MWTEDETRIGLMPIHRKRITAKGIQPLISSQIRREYSYLFGMIEPLTGEKFMLELPDLDSEMMQLFMDEFSKTDPTSLHLVVIDNASSHDAKVNSGRKYYFYIFAGQCARTESDRKVLERVKRLDVRLRATDNERSQPTNQTRTQ